MRRVIGKMVLLASLLLTSAVQAEGFNSLVLKYPVTDPEMSGDDLDEAIRSKSVEIGINHVFFAFEFH